MGKNGRKGHTEDGAYEPMRMQEVAHHTWPECYSVGYRRDIVRQNFFLATFAVMFFLV